jgi:hypothetical protein
MKTKKKKTYPKVHITAADLAALPEYSASLPTGTYLGKRWKRDCGPDRDSGRKTWFIGEFYPIDIPGEVGIRWSEVWLVPAYGPTEIHPKEAKTCLCHTEPYKFGVCHVCAAWRWKHER